MTYSQPNIQNSDDLAALFARNLTLQPQPNQVPREVPPAPEPEPEIKYSITQHYHHSAHIAHQNEPQAEQQRPASEPPQIQQFSVESFLNAYGVDHTTLSLAQLELFWSADDTQKLRLIELWRICPSVNARENPSASWNTTTIEQEQRLAQLRYERKLAEEEQQNTVMSMDGTPLTPIQTGSGQWVATYDVEPYMMSGYEALARREYEESEREKYEEAMERPKDVYSHFGTAVGGPNYRPATDPVYDNEWMRKQQTMENQYGLFQQMG
ncbi:uncharacterized protein F4812DRAFT_113301 [Daldinia caldariorum]|uniref:uncharacterized protein n=1 Tax=Daldinia caldariorum TaxID=326644 RepID=UPI00200844CA|nr:uncharacterized protein F4812DRAFT_113301 [Daldinia caldariorum]KAI1465816.1 hypothetical protein F4812DRAFT_113301 [Daldinia caldariorum]